MSTIHIFLATAHVGASLQQLLDAFVYAPADIPDYSTTYWLDYSATPMVLKDYLYNTLVGNTCVVVYLRHAERNNEGVHPRFYSSKFNVTAIMWVLRCSPAIKIWRLYVVFVYDWRIIAFPVGN